MELVLSNLIPGEAVMTHNAYAAATFRSNTFLVWCVTNGIIRYNGTFEIFRTYRNLGNDECTRAKALRAGWKDK